MLERNFQKQFQILINEIQFYLKISNTISLFHYNILIQLKNIDKSIFSKIESHFAWTNLKDFLINSRKFPEKSKTKKADICEITAPAFNFIKFYKILENAKKIPITNLKNYKYSMKMHI